ncbi:sulfurtransferase [Sutcliffiella halmapala]|uniref:sulfurtransferase n=1 Tax=Sutcliffiella halmapala TaxID=79882 RepID=UPI000994A96F|nr:sulfurtransferase [Sutcliffiella halmapala]
MQAIVEPQWVKEHLESLVIIDCRFHLNDPLKGRQEYSNEHIPQAFYFDLDQDLSGTIEKHGGRHPLPDLNKLRDKLEAVGVSNDVTVVLYDDQNSAMASRLWWLLSYLGHDKTYILNGGFKEWKRQGYPVSTSPSIPIKKGTFIPVVQQNMVVSAHDILRDLKAFELRESYLIDSREPKRYLGLEEPIDKKAGHIPGAYNYFWMDNLTANRWRNEEELKQQFAELDPSKEIIVYCGSGVTACPNVLALKEAGFTNVKLYPGSWSDWISYEENPISTSSR